MPTISPSALEVLLKADAPPQLIDVRTPGEFAAAHVPGARNIPLDQLRPKALVQEGVLSPELPLYVLCGSGGRAARAAEQLSRDGFAHPIVVDGGTRAWQKAGFPVERKAGGAISLERQVRIAAGALVLTGLLLAHFLHPAFLFLAGFVGAGLVFSGITDWCGMALLLAKLPWNRPPSCGCGGH